MLAGTLESWGGPWRTGGDPRVLEEGPQTAGGAGCGASGTPGCWWDPRVGFCMDHGDPGTGVPSLWGQGAGASQPRPHFGQGSVPPLGARAAPPRHVPPPDPSTILVEPGCTASLTELGDVCIAVGSGRPSAVGTQLDPVQLSIFSHRFMSIAGGHSHRAGGLVWSWGGSRVKSVGLGACAPALRARPAPRCPRRADGPDPAAHGHLHQHQGAPRLLLRPFRAGWGAGVQRPPHPRAPGCHAGDRPVSGEGAPRSPPPEPPPRPPWG